MHELDHGEAGWLQLEVLLALELDDEVLGGGGGFLILELELHPGVDLHHGTGGTNSGAAVCWHFGHVFKK